MCFFYGHIIFFLQILVFAFFDQSYKVDVLNYLPALYRDASKKVKAKFPKSFLKNLIEGIVVSITIIYVGLEILKNTVDNNGKEVDFEGVEMVYIFSLFFIMGIKVILIFKSFISF